MARTRTIAGSSAAERPASPAVERAGRVAVVAALGLAALLQIHRLDDSDTWWHLATGRTIWETGAVPHVDPFSYSAPGTPWTNRQWLFELVLYLGWLVAGPAGPSLLTGAAFVGAYALVARLLRRRLPAWTTAVLLTLAILVAVERFVPRPEAATLCFLAALLLLLDGPITWPVAALLVALQATWANCHALSVLGLVPIGATLAAALGARLMPMPAGWRAASARPPAETLRLAVVLAGALAAEAATPFGVAGAIFPLRLLADISGERLLSYTVVEHRATRFAELSPVAGAALVALGATGVLALVGSIRRLRLDHVLTALAFAWLATLARRNVALLGIGIAPLLASGLAPLAARLDAWLARRGLRRVASWALAGALLILCARVVTGGFYVDARLTRVFGLGESWLLYPARAVDFVEAAAPSGRVLNDDVLGGYFIWRGHPVFFDGRLQLYPEAIYLDWQRMLDDPRTFAEVAARWGFTAAVLHHPSPGRLELARAIAAVPGWRVAYLDGGGIVLVADGQAPGTPAGIDDEGVAFVTPGIAGLVEPVAAALRGPREQAMALYQRGRAIHYLYGPPAFDRARRDFRATLALEPDNAEAMTGLRATTGP